MIKTKNLFFLLPAPAWIIDWFRAIRLPDSEYNKPLIIDLPGHGDSKGSSSNNIESYSQFLIDALKASMILKIYLFADIVWAD